MSYQFDVVRNMSGDLFKGSTMETTPEEMAAAIAYANRRHMETGRRRIVSQFGHVWLDCSHNRRGFKECGFAVFYRSRRV